jgi:outer membrane protein TolC
MSSFVSVRMHGRLPFACGLMLWLLFVAAPAWPATNVSFHDALRLAVERAPALQARQAQVEAAREDAARASALPDPRLTLGLANVPVTGAEAFDLHADNMTMKQLGLMQAFPAKAKRIARRQLAERMVDQAQAMGETERLVVQQAAAQAWIGLWAAGRETDALRAQREQAALAARLAKARLAGGTGSATDAMAAQSAALDLDNRIDMAIAGEDVARATLARWLDIEPEGIATTGSPPDPARLPIDEAELLASVDRQAPLLPWPSREAVAQASIDAALAEKRPDWSLGASYGQRSRTPGGMPRSDMLMLEVSVGLPLFTRNRQDRDVAARRAELAAVAAGHEDARRVQRDALRRTLAQWNGLKRQIARMDNEALPLAHDRSQTALAAYRSGGSLQPWLQARRDELDLHVEHARHFGDLGRAWAALAFLLPDQEAQP